MFLKNKNIIFEIRRSKVTDYAALMGFEFPSEFFFPIAHAGFTVGKTWLLAVSLFCQQAIYIYLTNLYQ